MSARIPLAPLQGNTLVQGGQCATENQGKHPSCLTEPSASTPPGATKNTPKNHGSLHPQRDNQTPPFNGYPNSWSSAKAAPSPSQSLAAPRDIATQRSSGAEFDRRSFRDVLVSREASPASTPRGDCSMPWKVLTKPASQEQSFGLSRQNQSQASPWDEAAAAASSCGADSTGAASPEQQAHFVSSAAATSRNLHQEYPEVGDKLGWAQDTPAQESLLDSQQDHMTPRGVKQDKRTEMEILLCISPSPDRVPLVGENSPAQESLVDSQQYHMTPRAVKQFTRTEMEILLGIPLSPDRASRVGEDSPGQQSLLDSQDQMTPRPVKQLTRTEIENLLGIIPSPDRASRVGEDSTTQESFVDSQPDHLTPRAVKQDTRREMEVLLGISPSPDRASRVGEDSPIQASILDSQDHLTPRPVKQLTPEEMEVLLGIIPSPGRASRVEEDSPIQQSLLDSQDHMTPRPVKQLTTAEKEILLGIIPSPDSATCGDEDSLDPQRPAKQGNRSEMEILLSTYPSPESLPHGEAAPFDARGSSLGSTTEGSRYDEQRSAVPLLPITQTSSGPTALSRLSPDSACDLLRLTANSLDYTSTHEVKEGQDSLEDCKEPSQSNNVAEGAFNSYMRVETTEDSRAPEPRPVPSDALDWGPAAVNFHGADEESPGGAVAVDPLLEPPFAKDCEIESPFANRLLVRFDFDGVNQGAQRDIGSILSDGTFTAWLAGCPFEFRDTVTWTVRKELETLWQAAEDGEAMRSRMEEAEAALARERQRREEEPRDVDDGASSSDYGDWPTWSDSDEEEEEAAAGGRGAEGPERRSSPETKVEEEEPRAKSLVTSPRKEKLELERKCDDLSGRMQEERKRLRKLREEGERLLAECDKPRRGKWTQKPGKETEVVVISTSEAPSSGSSSTDPGETSTRGAGVQLCIPSAYDPLAEPPNGSPAASVPLQGVSSSSPPTLAAITLSSRENTNHLRETEDGESDTAAAAELPCPSSHHPEPNRRPEGNTSPTSLLWLSQAGRHQGTCSGMGGGHPSPGVYQERQQGAHGCGEVASPGGASAEAETQTIKHSSEGSLVESDRTALVGGRSWLISLGMASWLLRRSLGAIFLAVEDSDGDEEEGAEAAGGLLRGDEEAAQSATEDDPHGDLNYQSPALHPFTHRSPVASLPVQGVSLPSPLTLADIMASGGGATNPLFETEGGDSDNELPCPSADHPEPNRCPEGNTSPTSLLWLSQAGRHRGTCSGMGGGHPAPGVLEYQERRQRAHGCDELPCHCYPATSARRNKTEWDPEIVRKARILGISLCLSP